MTLFNGLGGTLPRISHTFFNIVQNGNASAVPHYQKIYLGYIGQNSSISARTKWLLWVFSRQFC